jgi:hypothetical protein
LWSNRRTRTGWSDTYLKCEGNCRGVGVSLGSAARSSCHEEMIHQSWRLWHVSKEGRATAFRKTPIAHEWASLGHVRRSIDTKAYRKPMKAHGPQPVLHSTKPRATLKEENIHSPITSLLPPFDTQYRMPPISQVMVRAHTHTHTHTHTHMFAARFTPVTHPYCLQSHPPLSSPFP